MTRIEDLTLKLVDGLLTDAEAEELIRRVERDPAEAATHLRLLDLEGDLRGGREDLDLAEDVLGRLVLAREARIERGVMDRLRVLSPRPRTRRIAAEGSAPRSWLLAGVAAAFLVVVAASLFVPSPPRSKPAFPSARRIEPLPSVEPKVEPSDAPPSPKERVLSPRGSDPGSPLVLPPREVLPAPVPSPAEAPVPDAVPRARPPAETVVAVADLESSEGDVRIHTGAASVPARVPQAITADQDLETATDRSTAALRLPEGTRLRLTGKGRLRVSPDGRRVIVDRGILFADVARQPAGSSLTFATPHGEARVLGTRLVLHVDPSSTRLEVQEGRVRLSRDESAADVAAGHFAVAAAGVRPVARPLPPSGAVVGFTLINLDDGRPVPGFDPMPDHAVVDLAALPSRNLNLRANPSSAAVGSVRFDFDGGVRLENAAPLELASETGRNPFSWPPGPGTHTLTATPFPGRDGAGTPGGALTLVFRVVDSK